MPQALKLEGVKSIALGGTHSCALLQNGTAKCWGHNGYGQLGDGTKTDRNAPTDVVDLKDAVELAAGDHHTCARLADHTVKCWGKNVFGQIGDGTLEDQTKPTFVSF